MNYSITTLGKENHRRFPSGRALGSHGQAGV